MAAIIISDLCRYGFKTVPATLQRTRVKDSSCRIYRSFCRGILKIRIVLHILILKLKQLVFTPMEAEKL